MARPKALPRDDPDERKSVSMPRSMWADIDAYAEQERIRTQAEAHRRIVQAGLRALLKRPEAG
jgi:hypothetical protein